MNQRREDGTARPRQRLPWIHHRSLPWLAFGLYMGEHYVFDVVVGAVYSVEAFVLTDHVLLRLRRGRRTMESPRRLDALPFRQVVFTCCEGRWRSTHPPRWGGVCPPGDRTLSSFD